MTDLKNYNTNYITHTLYTDDDSDKPEAICDSNGQVCLDLCKVCGAGEVELGENSCAEFQAKS